MSECCGRWRPVAAGDALSLDQRLKLLRDLYVQRCNTFVERALAAILGAGRQIKVFLRVAESCDQLGLGIDHHEDTPAVAGGSFPRLGSPAGHQAKSGSARVTGHAASYWIYRPFCMARNGVAHSMHLGLRREASVRCTATYSARHSKFGHL